MRGDEDGCAAISDMCMVNFVNEPYASCNPRGLAGL